jgi:hypothetical protein
LADTFDRFKHCVKVIVGKHSFPAKPQNVLDERRGCLDRHAALPRSALPETMSVLAISPASVTQREVRSGSNLSDRARSAPVSSFYE